MFFTLLVFIEEVGFEPTINSSIYTDFQNQRFNPLSHSSRGHFNNIYQKTHSFFLLEMLIKNQVYILLKWEETERKGFEPLIS